MTNRPPPIGSTLFTLFAMRQRVTTLRTRLGDPNATDREILAAIEEANRWTLAVETLLASAELRSVRSLADPDKPDAPKT